MCFISTFICVNISFYLHSNLYFIINYIIFWKRSLQPHAQLFLDFAKIEDHSSELEVEYDHQQRQRQKITFSWKGEFGSLWCAVPWGLFPGSLTLPGEQILHMSQYIVLDKSCKKNFKFHNILSWIKVVKKVI